MNFFAVALITVLLVVDESLANSCKTCRGSDCIGQNIFELDCRKFVPALPFESQLISYEAGEKAEYGCLDLTYYVGESLEQIRQCVMSDELASFCAMLENVINIESCSIESTGLTRVARSVDEPNLEELDETGSGEPDDTSTPEPIPTLPGGGGAMNLVVSFTCLLTIIATVLL